jgi:hypothetical protein
MLQDYNFGMSTIMGQSPESPAGTPDRQPVNIVFPAILILALPLVAEWNFNENNRFSVNR